MDEPRTFGSTFAHFRPAVPGFVVILAMIAALDGIGFVLWSRLSWGDLGIIIAFGGVLKLIVGMLILSLGLRYRVDRGVLERIRFGRTMGRWSLADLQAVEIRKLDRPSLQFADGRSVKLAGMHPIEQWRLAGYLRRNWLERDDATDDDMRLDYPYRERLNQHADLWPPLWRSVHGVRVVDLDRRYIPPTMPLHRILFVLFAQLAWRRQFRELHFEPWPEDEEAVGVGGSIGLRVICRIEDNHEDLVPPPREVAELMLVDLETVAGLRTPRQRLGHAFRRLAGRLDGQDPTSRRGAFRMACGDASVEVGVTVWPSPIGPRYFLDFDYRTEPSFDPYESIPFMQAD